MQVFAIILAMQIIIGGIILNTSSNSSPAKSVRHSIKQVLGSSLLAQDATPTDTPTPDQPTDTPTPDQTQPTDTPIPTEQPTDTPAVADTPTPDQIQPTDTPTLPPTEDISPTPTQEQNTPSPIDTIIPSIDQISPTSTSESDTIPTSDSSLPPQINAVIINPSDVLTNTDNINQSAINISNRQDEALALAVTPQEKTNLLISSAQNNVQEITTNLVSNDFTTTSFLTQRLVGELTQTQQVVQAAPAINQNQLQQEAKAFCQKVDFSLKTQQLQVPEELEQDIEIARGTCLNIQ